MRLPITFRGSVQPGRGVGRKLGFPTANIAGEFTLPRTAWGVYCCRVTAGGARRPGVAHLGPADVVGEHQPRLEVHLLGWSGDLVGQVLAVELVSRLRPTRVFADLPSLARQAAADCAAARRFFQAEDDATASCGTP